MKKLKKKRLIRRMKKIISLKLLANKIIFMKNKKKIKKSLRLSINHLKIQKKRFNRNNKYKLIKLSKKMSIFKKWQKTRKKKIIQLRYGVRDK